MKAKVIVKLSVIIMLSLFLVSAMSLVPQSQAQANGIIIYVDASNTTGTSGPHTIAEAGSYSVQCRACAVTGSNPCTNWGQAEGWTE